MEPGPRTKARKRHLALLTLLALPGCGVFAPGDGVGFASTVAAPAELVAWSIGRLALDRWPGADPMPVRSSVPVRALGDGDFALELAMVGDQASFASNGRLAPPAHRLLQGERTTLCSPVFQAAASETRAPGRDGHLECTVRALRDGCRVELIVAGRAVDRAWIDRVASTCALLDQMRDIDSAFAAGDAPAAAARANRILCGLRPDRGCGVTELEAPLWSALAAARVRQGDVAAGRAAANCARDAARNAPAYALLLARVDERLARFPHPNEPVETGLTTLAEGPGDARLRLAARARIAELADRGELRPDPATIAGRAAQLFAAGDLVGAEAWATRLRVQGIPSSAIADDERARAAGHRREAFVHAVDRLDRGPFDPEVLDHLVADSIACGDPIAGLRVVARCFGQLAGADRARAEGLARRLLDVVGSGTVARVAVSEDCGALALLAAEHAPDARSAAEVAAVRRNDTTRHLLETGIGTEALAAPGR
ncbi:MAG: hypothetical protein U1F36_03650 [Planctomycetota bacterium]